MAAVGVTSDLKGEVGVDYVDDTCYLKGPDKASTEACYMLSPLTDPPRSVPDLSPSTEENRLL